MTAPRSRAPSPARRRAVVDEATLAGIREAAAGADAPVLGITGTGGSGKSSLTDELIRRLRLDQQDKLRVAVLAVDPTRSRGGGALLGDRIRMSALDGDRVFFRSLATRGGSQVPTHLDDVLSVVRAAGFDLVILETPGIGQGDAAIVDYADVSLYVMTPEFGASSQLEKIDMLDRADVVAINKFERRGAEDALRDVGRQMVRNREAFGKGPPTCPSTARPPRPSTTTASRRSTRSCGTCSPTRGCRSRRACSRSSRRGSRPRIATVVPAARVRYLAEISDTVRGYHEARSAYAAAASRVQRLESVRGELARRAADDSTAPRARSAPSRPCSTRPAPTCRPTSPPRWPTGPRSSSPTPATSRS